MGKTCQLGGLASLCVEHGMKRTNPKIRILISFFAQIRPDSHDTLWPILAVSGGWCPRWAVECRIEEVVD
jgi:hypothetical protein